MGNSTIQRPDPFEPERISCAMCKREIPRSVAQTLEGPDYLIHFCGIDCVDEWKRQGGEERTKDH